jgi:inosine-uridine nucleoside N-ribohydrolase
MMLAGASPGLEVLAVTTVGGNVPLAQATLNARRVLPIAWPSAPPPPLYAGLDLARESAEHVHGADGLGNVFAAGAETAADRSPPRAPLLPVSAWKVIPALARARPGEVTLITLGPLSNAAAALRDDPEGTRLLRGITIMGGSFREGGNATAAAEFNIYADPESAAAICESSIPLTWVPLDVTHRCVLSQEALSSATGERARFAQSITAFNMRYHELGFGAPACLIHDAVAVGLELWPELYTLAEARVDVELTGAHTRGATVADLRPRAYRPPFPPPNSRVALAADGPEVIRRFLRRLSGG